jgi:hypothetical protein
MTMDDGTQYRTSVLIYVCVICTYEYKISNMNYTYEAETAVYRLIKKLI